MHLPHAESAPARQHRVTSFVQWGTSWNMNFDLDLYDLALESLEAAVDDDPMGDWNPKNALAWLIRYN